MIISYNLNIMPYNLKIILAILWVSPFALIRCIYYLILWPVYEAPEDSDWVEQYRSLAHEVISLTQELASLTQELASLTQQLVSLVSVHQSILS